MYLRSKRYPELFRKSETGPWWCFLPSPSGGRQLRESTGHRDDRAAHIWYLDRVRRSDSASDKKERTLRDALLDRLEWLKLARESNDPTRKKLSAATIDFYTKKSRHLLRLLGPATLLSALGHEEIRRYIATRSKESAKATTISKEFAALSMAMRLARKDGVTCPVFSDIVPEDFQARYVPKTRWLGEDEVGLVLRQLEPHRAAVFALLVSTGASYPSEVAPLRPRHVDGYDIHIPGTKRGTRDRHVIVPGYARKWFAFAIRHMPKSGFEKWGSVRRDLHRAAARAGIDPFSPNDVRRTFAQYLVRSGVPYELAAPMMGHASTKMLRDVYGKRDHKALSALVEAALKNAPKDARKAS